MKKNGKRRAVRLSPRALLFPLLWIGALLFTQFLRSSVSNAFFWFICILPILSVLYALIGRSFVQVYVSCKKVRISKGENVEYEIKLINSSPFPLPHIDAVVTEPDRSGVRCSVKKLVTSLVSFGGCVIKNEVVFPYRGSYDIGVECVYVYDLLGMVAFRLDVFNYAHLTVFPNRVGIDRARMREMTDDAASSSRRKNTSEFTEPSDIKNYVPGDPIKSIHWKLSSKTEDIKVRKYDSVENRHTYIFCDLSAAEKLPEKSSRQIYKTLKSVLAPKHTADSRRLKRLRTRVAALSEQAQTEEEEKKKAFSGIRSYFRMRRVEKAYRKNLRRGMTEEQASTVRMVDELIMSSDSRLQHRRNEAEEEKKGRIKLRAEKAELRADEMAFREKAEDNAVRAELDRILKSTKEKENALRHDEKAFGGRIKKEYLADYDEMCADAVIEITSSLALDEMMKGNVVTICWFDEREESGVAAYTVSSPADFDSVFIRLACAPVAEEKTYVAALTGAVNDNGTSKIKIVTSNIDPVSAGETENIPSKLGGIGSGCSAEVLIYSPNERYEDAPARAAYSAGAANRFISRGMASSVWVLNGLVGSDASYIPIQ